jgi:ABC-type uncharacterized transport system substrate-binding protein
MISRRRFLGSAGAAILAAPLAAGAEQAGKVYKVGYLWAGSSSDTIAEGTTSFRSGERFEHALHDLGWVKGRNIAFEYRFGEGDFNRLPELATELVGLGLDVILAQAGPETNALKQATKRIPIVFGAHGDPVGSGDVQSLAHPGGNITGLALMHPELGGKQLELLRQAAPRVSRVAVVWNAANPLKVGDWRALQAPAQSLGIVPESGEVRRSADFKNTFAPIRRHRPDALLTLGDPLTYSFRETIVDFATKERLPAMYPYAAFAVDGGLMSYGADLLDLIRRSAGYVDEILKGAKPADLPVEQPTKFELVINLRTAKALGLTIPPSLLLRADQVIE